MQTLLAFALASVPIAGLIVFLALPAKKRRFGWLAVAAYVALYLPLSLMGRFQTSNHGGMDWRDEWLPRGLAEPYRRETKLANGRVLRGRTKTRLTYAGNLFWPLIILDNLVWHREHESDLAK